jgi:AAA+ superfamily predicted ATPase
MYTEIIKIIEGGLNKDLMKVRTYSELLASKLESKEDQGFKKRIINLLENAKGSNLATLNGVISKPADIDSSLPIVDVVMPSGKMQELVLSENVNKVIKRFVKTISVKDSIESSGIKPNLTMLLHGPPGCGKTSIAFLIAKEANLPLVVARFDALISSLLGSTAKNLRKIFEYADSFPCILFIDEFDAIAKARNDQYEHGELKRVINSLLQNIDRFSENNILIAATNHSEILDKAVWRRFETVIELSNPNSDSEIATLLELFLNGYGNTIIRDKKKKETIIKLMSSFTPSDIKSICQVAIRNAVIDSKESVAYSSLLEQIYQKTNHNHIDPHKFIKYLHEHNTSQTEISHILSISLRQVKDILSIK